MRPDKRKQHARELVEPKREVLKLRAELRRTQGECDFLKKRRVLYQEARVKYAFINEHRHRWRVAMMCRMLGLHRSGFYDWLHKRLSGRAIEDRRHPRRSRFERIVQTNGTLIG